MPTLAIRQSTWQGFRQNQRDLTRWMSADLELGTGALYENPGGVLWIVFDDGRLNLEMFASHGSLANVIGDLSSSWKPPTVGNGQNKQVDRPAVAAEAISRVQDVIVLPADIDYGPDDNLVANPQQHTIGIEHVLVSGTPIIQGGAPVESLSDRLPGRYVKMERE